MSCCDRNLTQGFFLYERQSIREVSGRKRNLQCKQDPDTAQDTAAATADAEHGARLHAGDVGATATDEDDDIPATQVQVTPPSSRARVGDSPSGSIGSFREMGGDEDFADESSRDKRRRVTGKMSVSKPF